MVELLHRNLLQLMWRFSDSDVFCGCCDPSDVAAATVAVIIVVVLFL